MTDAPSNREALLEALVAAALDVLSARQHRMLTIEEWTALARATAACQQRRTAEYLTDDDLDAIAQRSALDWNEAADGPLPTLDE